ncbi:MAG: hypothetical protein FJ253_05580 [Phycisphaerae bacterium]|nr:hypothetical protein [Phycisphaerae bacterium]
MGILEQLLAIARVTFSESIRQPVVAVVALTGVIILVLSNPLTTFTLEDDQRMLVEVGMSTTFLAGLLLAVLLATSVLTREIENRTVLTVVSKPVDRPVLLLGKFLGVLGAILASYAFLACVFMLVVRHGVMPTVTTPYQMPVLIFGIGAALLAIGFAGFANYFYGWSFGATTVLTGIPLLLLAFLAALPFKHDFSVLPLHPPPSNVPGYTPDDLGRFVLKNLNLELWKAIALAGVGLTVLTAFAVAISTRLGLVLTLVTTIGVFVMGLLSDWVFARRIASLDKAIAANPAGVWWDADHLTWGLCKFAQAIIPNFQTFWLVDAVNQKKPIVFFASQGDAETQAYGLMVLGYGALMTAMALALGTLLFQRREVG